MGKPATEIDNPDDLVNRLQIRASIRRRLREERKQNEPDRIADLLDEAANEIKSLRSTVVEVWTWDHFK